MDDELNLNDPRVVEELKRHDINRATESKSVAEQVKDLKKGASLTLKLSSSELAMCQRAAEEAGANDWKDWLKSEIKTAIFKQKVGTPRIGGPSWMEKVTAPTSQRFK